MPRIPSVLLVLALAVRPAGADSFILYATAATAGRIDGYCLDRNGSFAPTAAVMHVDLAGANPRRLLFVAESRAGQVDAGVLYVAEPDRVESFRLDANGRVARHCGGSGSEACRGRTEVDTLMDPRDLAVSADDLTLYVVQRGRSRIAAFPLDPQTGLLTPPAQPNDDSFTSCVQGAALAGYQELVVDSGRVYVSSDGATNRVDVFQTLPDGRLCSGTLAAGQVHEPCTDLPTCTPVLPTDCPTHPGTKVVTETTPLCQRRRLGGPKSMVVANGMLYVEERTAHYIGAFPIDQLERPTPTPGKGEKRPKPAPKRSSRTAAVVPYQRMVLSADSLIGSQFFRGRVDGYHLKAQRGARCTSCPTAVPCCLPREPNGRTEEDVRTSPVGIDVATVGARQVLYVAGGEIDQIRAYRVGPTGLPAHGHFSSTEENKGSFPNDVAVAMLAGNCR